MNSASSPSRERKKAENGYIPEGVMQFMATVDDVTDDGYVIVKTDTQSERFPQIRKDVRYRLSMEAYDPGIYNDKLVPGNVVIVACKGIFEGEGPIQCQQLKRYWHLPRIKNQTRFQRK